MYSLSQLKKAFESPERFLWEVNRLYYTRLNTRSHYPSGIDLFEEDWDNLLILDACRYDMFERTHDLPGRLESRTSRASATKEWIHANFDGRELLDTVYVTASPILYRNRDTVDVTFHDVVDVWQESGWDDEYRTVLPQTTTEAARRAASQYPDKRILVHYLQPHFPFVGEVGLEHFDPTRLNFEWMDLTTGQMDVDTETIRRAFDENLELVLPYVEELLDELGGKTVVTSDHGQMLGERGFPVPIPGYGHPPGVYNEALTRVPWLVYENGARRDVVAEASETEQSDVSEDVVSDRLRQLGYVE
jgi:hypothetical protein